MATLSGTNGNDSINGSSTADTISGLAGNDILIGNGGNDILNGGLGADIMQGGIGNDTYNVDDAGDIITENNNEGTDLVQSSISYTLGAYLENLILTGIAALNGIGNALDNVLTGNTGVNTLDGGAGNDTLNGGAGIDTMIGGIGNDLYYVDNLGDVVTENAAEGTDTVSSSITYTLGANVENLTLTGTGALNGTGNGLDNVLTGNSGNNTLNAGIGNDTLIGGAGTDTMIGGTGDDIYVVDSSTDIVTENAGEGTDTVQASVTITNLAANVENLTIIGVSALSGTGNALNNILTGNNAGNTLNGGLGNDTLIGGLGNDVYVIDAVGDTIVELAGQGTDSVQSSLDYTLGLNLENLTLTGATNINATGNAVNNSISGNTGNNILDGGLGADSMSGGLGNDTYIVDNAADTVLESVGAGTDTVQTGISYTVGANIENLTLTGVGNVNATGNTLANTLTGNAGNNILSGASGADTMIGGAGNDTYVVENVGDIVTENAAEGTDTVQSSVTHTLGANIENLTLIGSTAISGTGNGLDNVITGNTAVNTLNGGGGNDTLNGGSGADTMIGGTGDDTYVVDHAGDVITENAGEGTDTVQSSLSHTLAANVENLTLTGLTGVNGTGNAANNTIIGNISNNIINGGLGADTMIGGAGNDTYVIDNAGDIVTELVGGGTDTIQTDVTFDISAVANVENLTLTGIGNINGTGNAINNVINGNSGNNIIDGGAGNDTMSGGTGDDTYIIDSATDIIIEATTGGNDLVNASVSYVLATNVESLTLTGGANINGTGNGTNNTITGNTGNNILDGGVGADTLIGGLGNDTYVVDNVLDVITEGAGAGTDLVQASISYSIATFADVENITLTGGTSINATGNANANILTGNIGSNVLDGGAGADTMVGGLGNDIYVVDNAGDAIVENAAAGTDTIQSSINADISALLNLENITLTGAGNINATGNLSNNVIVGNTGDNIIDGGAGADNMSGGTGNDTYTVDNIGDIITEAAAAGTDIVNASISYVLTGNVENLTLTGAGNINATGNTVANILTGNTGNNILNGSTGADTMIGGLGDDTYVVDNALDIITENAAEGTDLVQSTASYILSANVENLTLIGSAAINGTGNAGINTLTGNTGNNILDGGAGADIMIGGTGNDTYIIDDIGDTVTEAASGGTDTVQTGITYTIAANIENLTLTGVGNIDGTGNISNNIITGNDGNNIIDGATGADTMAGGLGDDTYIVDNTGDIVTEASAAGTDIVQAGITYTLGINVENLTLTGVAAINGTGNTLDNILVGNTAANTLNGGTGADTMSAGQGNDTYVVDNAGDIVTELAAEGTDLVQSSITYTLTAEVENLTLTGTTAIDGTGNAANNTITGNAGNNVIDGGLGNDTMLGGLGDDTYIVDNALDVVTEAASAGNDTIETGITYTLGANIENLVLTGVANIDGTGNAEVNRLDGNSGNNILDGGLGSDAMVGGLGDDTYIIDNINDIIVENAGEGTDIARSSVSFSIANLGNVENLTLTGTDNINATGNSNANILTGNTGNNTLDGGAGADTMIGGLGDDTYAVDDIADVVTENAAEGTDLVQSSITYTLGANLENLTLTGVANINATGNAVNNVITGNIGDNTIDGGTGADTMAGGLGNDTYVVDNVGDVVTEAAAAGTDTVQSSITYSLAALAAVENLTLTGAAAINGTGNALANTITGNTGNNIIDGGAGADTMIGGAGNDTYTVDNAGDIVTEAAASGTDLVNASVTYTLTAEVENLTLSGVANINGTGNALANTITGNNGNNTLDGGTGADALSGGLGDDTYVIDNVGDTVTEAVASGTDTIRSDITFTLAALANVEHLVLTGAAAINGTGNALNNDITGNAQNNTIDGGTGADNMTGGAGDDTYIVDNAGDDIVELAAGGTDNIQSSATYFMSENIENMTLTGVAAINGTGNSSNNTITGNTAANVLDGGTGVDTLIGGGGNDTYIVDDLLDVVVEGAAAGTDTVQAITTYSIAALANVENLTLAGSAHINGTGNTLANTLTGNTGNNRLDGGTGIDTMIGGLGDDTYVVDVAGDIVTEGAAAGTDTVESVITYTIAAAANLENITLTGVGNINATGNASANVLLGNAGNNLIDGGTGADTMAGGQGNDTYTVDNAGDTVTEEDGAGTDLVNSAVTFTLGADIENLTLTGAAAINGTGNALANTITGNTGNNIINGGAGADTMAGGTGNDSYIVDNIGDIVTEGAGAGTDDITSSVTFVMGANIENLVLTGSSNIDGTGNAVVNIITGNSGNNILDGGTGADTLIGGTGNDTYIVDNVGDIITEALSAGTDTIQSSVTFTASANVENLTLTGAGAINATGNTLNNVITGNTGANVIDGGGGIDTMIGGAGNDTYTVDSASDVIIEVGGEGTDTVNSSINYILSENLENLTLTGAGNINGTGNANTNTINGNAGNNILDGGFGNDTMVGGLGNDTYIVDSVADVVTEAAAAGTDTVEASVSFTIAALANVENITLTGTDNITATGNAAANTLTGNAGANTLNGGTGADILIGGLSDDIYVVDNIGDIVTELASQGTDTIQSSITWALVANVENLTLTGAAAINGTGNTLANYLIGNTGINTLDGGSGADTMQGGLGNDIYIIDNVGDIIIEIAGEGTDTAQSSISYSLIGTDVENLTLTGATNINATGSEAVNTLTGNTGNNILDGGLGADTMVGGTGDDTYVVDHTGDIVTEAAASGNDTVQSSITYSIAALANVEHITLTGSANVNATGNASNNTINGNTGNNTIDGGAGNDTMAGGTGDDIYVVDAVGDIVTESVGAGTDTVQSAVTYTLGSNVENLTLTGAGVTNATGNTLANTITGNAQNNTIDGGAGADTMIGGAGNDTYVVDNVGDAITEGAAAGTDLVQSSVTHTLSANVENLTLTGTASVNATGNTLANVIIGNTGANIIDGGGGADTITGGGGADTFRFMGASVGVATITDFSTVAGDRLDLRDVLDQYDPLADLLTDFVRITDAGPNSTVEVDRDGTGTAFTWTQISSLTGITGLTDEVAQATAGNIIVS